MHEDNYRFVFQPEVIIEVSDNAKSGTGRIVRVFADSVRSVAVAKAAAEEMNQNSDGPHYRVGHWEGTKEPKIGELADYRGGLAVSKGELDEVLEKNKEWLEGYRRIKNKRAEFFEKVRRRQSADRKKSNVDSARKKSRAKRRHRDGGIEL